MPTLVSVDGTTTTVPLPMWTSTPGLAFLFSRQEAHGPIDSAHAKKFVVSMTALSSPQ